VIKLTETTIKSLEPKGSRYEIPDSEIKGFVVRVNPSGKVVYLLKVDFQGESYRLTLVETDFKEARAQAINLLEGAEAGNDPRSILRAYNSPATVEEITNRFFEECLPKLRPSTQNVYSWVIRSIIIKQLGKMRVGAVDADVCKTLHGSLSDTPRQANMALAILSRLLDLAESWGHRVGANPAKIVKRNDQKIRDRVLTRDELSRLIETLNSMLASGSANYNGLMGIKMLILTGQRKDLIRTLKWSQVDLATGFLRFPQGARKPDRLLPLSKSAILLLESLPSRHSKWVFPATRKAGPIATFDDTWKVVRDLADLKDVHLNDLRMTYAGRLLDEGIALTLVGDLLGTISPQTLKRYAHLEKLKTAAIDIA